MEVQIHEGVFDDMIDTWKDYLWKNPKNFIRRIGRFLARLASWISVLWRDEDWDYSNILRILQYKISRTRDCIVENQNIENADKYGLQMKQAEEMIQQVVDSNFFSEEWTAHNKKYPIKFEPAEKGLVKMVDNDETEAPARKALVDKTHAAEEEAWSELWDFLKANMQYWWD